MFFLITTFKDTILPYNRERRRTHMEMQKELNKIMTPGFVKKIKTFENICELLDARWATEYTAQTVDRMHALDAALGNPSKNIKKAIIAGKNSKSLTLHFATRLLREENIISGVISSPHFTSYAERITTNNETISERLFIDCAQDVIAAAETVAPAASSMEIIIMTAFVYFKKQSVELALLELDQISPYHPLAAFYPDILTITRITQEENNNHKPVEDISSIMSLVQKGTHVITGDQIKAHIAYIQKLTEEKGGVWEMPIRKLAALPYPFEQIHGRSAALAERIAQTYIKIFIEPTLTNSQDTLLIRPKGKKGRPTLEAKRKSELQPTKTMNMFWHNTTAHIAGRFQLLAKEKPLVLVDCASNLDAFENLLFGIRLLHYEKPIKGLTIIIGATKESLHSEAFVKALRYFFKKTSGSIALCPIEKNLAGSGETSSWDVDAITNDIKLLKIKARACRSLDEAYEYAKQSVDETDGLIVVTGSRSIVRQWYESKNQ